MRYVAPMGLGQTLNLLNSSKHPSGGNTDVYGVYQIGDV